MDASNNFKEPTASNFPLATIEGITDAPATVTCTSSYFGGGGEDCRRRVFQAPMQYVAKDVVQTRL